MVLRSKLEVLLELDLKELLAVQSDVTRLIEEKVLQLQLEVGLKSEGLDDKENVQELESDTDDYLLTQFDQTARDKLLKNGNVKLEEPTRLEPNNKGPDLSSPLRGTQSLPDSLRSIEEDLQLFPPKDNVEPNFEVCRNVLQSINTLKSENSPRKGDRRKRTCLESPAKRLKPLVSLNVNPITNKAWILEDFRANEDEEFIKRGRKRLASLKLSRFYRAGGRPPEVGAEHEEDLSDNTCEFENLRQRSKSPPGFGRLDFPTTQERVDDKKKSQEIIYKKTKHRFLEATCDKIPPQERQFIFKSSYLNQVVENGTFTWDDENLQIFYRR
ncbi:ssDNA endodeoxyribonuclease SAE2 TDEL_0F01050 [Torulaspora delbrueckii]|uniref:DNA endonuclease activator Ctp1 C-terminal domain-containing protein n=1 Tax=Torulaspora delbrueckii TaxID=4950 RepID=G8ZWC2_TORDE|nr:hypothetical protein TDEL_0F01050 [Torulaspora delbrueckii]CCE92916.1 hypothetical protein TDEL_0F01050 [Torulaspora delbrueckii]